MPALAAVAALLVGVGAGWLLFGRESDPPMDAAQQRAWAEFEASDEYDPGSVRMLGEQYGLTAWYATQDDASMECLMLTPTEQPQNQCGPVPDEEELSMGWGALTAGAPAADDEDLMVQAVVMRDTENQPAAFFQAWDVSARTDWTVNFQGTELDIARVIVADGADGDNLRVVGYDGDTPIWLDGMESCLIVADTARVLGKTCGYDGEHQRVRLVMPGVIYEVRQSNWGEQLTIIRGDGSPPSIDDTTEEQAD